MTRRIRPSPLDRIPAPDFDRLFDPRYGFAYRGAYSAYVNLGLFLVLSVGWAVFAVGYGSLAFLLHALSRRATAARRTALRVGLDARGALRVAHRASRHAPPTREMLLRAWEMRQTLEGKLLLGSLLGDADAAVDHSYIRDDEGEIVGRRGGVRRWLEEVCPELSRYYKTLMRHKALADKFRLACGLTDPDGAEDLLDLSVPEHVKDGRPAHGAAKARKHAAALLAKHRTAQALDEALWSALGLPRNRRRARSRAA